MMNANSLAQGEAFQAPLPFELSVADRDDLLLARVSGPLDVQYAPAFMERVEALCEAGRRVVIDLRAAEYVDSAGVRALLHLEERLAAHREELRLIVQPGSRVERVLTLLRLTDRFRIHRSSSEAADSREAAIE